jgi:O-succinylbenzoic acid--CoA ligase
MAKLRAFSVPAWHADAVLAQTHAAGDAALFIDPALSPALRDDICARFGPSSLTVIAPNGDTHTVPFADGVTLDDDAALVVLTSGSTGTPKGVELAHAALDAAVTQSLHRLSLSACDTVTLALPTHHIAGLLVGLRARALGAELLWCGSSAALAATNSALTALVPTQLVRLLDVSDDLSHLGTILLGGAKAEPALIDTARQHGATVVTTYGMSETCGGCVYDGVPLAGVEVAIDGADGAEGRILLRGPQLFRGYRTGRSLNVHPLDAWFATSDYGVLSGGELRVLGRLDDTVISGGENVPLAAVQAALQATPGVRDAFVLSRPDAVWGDEILAVIVSDVTVETVRTHLRNVLAAPYLPRRIRRVVAIPTSGLGKPDFAAAQALFDEPDV